MKPKISKRKEIIKIRAEINKKESKRERESIKPKCGSLKKLIKL